MWRELDLQHSKWWVNPQADASAGQIVGGQGGSTLRPAVTKGRSARAERSAGVLANGRGGCNQGWWVVPVVAREDVAFLNVCQPESCHAEAAPE